MQLQQQQLVRTIRLVDVVMIGIDRLCHLCSVGPAIGLAGSAVIIAFIINGIKILSLQQWAMPKWVDHTHVNIKLS